MIDNRTIGNEKSINVSASVRKIVNIDEVFAIDWCNEIDQWIASTFKLDYRF